LPFALEASAKANLVSKIENKDTILTERADKIIANQSKVFVEFYEGALLALDSLKKQGISVELSVYDIAPNRQALNRVLQTPALQKVDLIIGPARSDDLGPVSEFSQRHKIKLVYPLSNTNPELWKNPYLFQINTPDTLLFDKMANEIVRQASTQNLLVILPAGEDAYANAFMDKFRKKVYFQEFALNNKIKYKEYRMTRADENLNNLRALLDPIGKNYVVIPTNQEATISEIIPALAGVKEKMKAQVTLFGMTEWLRAQSIDPEDMFALNAQIFTFFALDYGSVGTRNFIAKYRQWYHTEPHAVSPYFQSSSSTSGFSRYGVWGHDVTYYFVYAMALRGRHFEYCPAPLDMHPLQFNFSFSRVSNWGGFYNQGLFLLRFNPDYNIIRSPVLFYQPMTSFSPGLSSGF
jgi:ABC-type branched-subunit amino acid transport system substrate-binding protein